MTKIQVKYIDTTTYEGGTIPDQLIHINYVTYYIESYTSPDSMGRVHVTLKVWKPF